MKHVIIGVGAAGITAAQTIRECDKEAEIEMISADEHVHSRCMLHKYMSHERNEETLSFIPERFFEENRIIWRKAQTVAGIDAEEKRVFLEGGLEVPFDKLLIATGADSFIPPIGDFRDADNVFGLRNLSDAQAIDQMLEPGSRVLVVGSGLVGMDAAYALLERGNQVTVVEMADRILPLQLDETAGKAYQDLFETAGCRFLLGKKASETIRTDGRSISAVLLDDGTQVDCDVVIVAAGVRPALACLTGIGIEAERCLQVNGTMETSCKDIYGAGDVTGLAGIWPNAMKQGQIAAYNMCGMERRYMDTYAMKNTMNFYGLTTLSLGRGVVEPGDEVFLLEDRRTYKKAIIRDGKLDSILLQGEMDYSGIYQYLIKNRVDIRNTGKSVFKLSFADFYGVLPDGQYDYQTE